MTSTGAGNDFRRNGLGQERYPGHFMPLDPGAEASAGFVRVPSQDRRPRESAPASLLKVERIMTRNARSCRPDQTLAAAAAAMCEADCRFLPVIDRDRRPIGVVTDGDICMIGSTNHRPLDDILVREAMSGLPAICHPDDDVFGVLEVMRERHIRHLPVVDREGLLEGVVSLTDLLLHAEEQDSPRLRQEVAAALRMIAQKHGNQRTIRHNPFVED